jgi:hypothetical protein
MRILRFMPFAEADLAALGRYIVEYSRLEGILALSISAMLEAAPYAGPMIVSTMSTQKLLKLMTHLAPRYADGDNKERLIALIKRVQREEDRRNVLLHSVWLEHFSQPGLLVRWKVRVSAQPGNMEELPTSMLVAHAQDVQELATELEELMQKIMITAGRPWPPSP